MAVRQGLNLFLRWPKFPLIYLNSKYLYAVLRWSNVITAMFYLFSAVVEVASDYRFVPWLILNSLNMVRYVFKEHNNAFFQCNNKKIKTRLKGIWFSTKSCNLLVPLRLGTKNVKILIKTGFWIYLTARLSWCDFSCDFWTIFVIAAITNRLC